MTSSKGNRASLLRAAAVALPLALVGLTPTSALAEPRPTPVPHDGSLVSFVTQHSAADPAPASASHGTDPAQPGADSRDPKPGAYRSAHEQKVTATTPADNTASWHSWEWRIDGGPGE